MTSKTLSRAVLLSTAALLFGVAPAIADSITPNVRPVPVGSSWEPSLSSVLGCVFYGSPSCDPATTLLNFDAIANQTTNTLFSATGPTTVTLNYEYTGNPSVIGLWSPNGPGTNMLPLFTGLATGANNGGATPATLQFTGGNLTITGACGIVNCQTNLAGSGIDPEAFGFFLSDPIGNNFYTSDFLNLSNEAHGLNYTDGAGNWAVAFEDQRLNSSDFDYNDEVLSLTGAVAAAVPEPATLVLLGTGLAGFVGRRKLQRHAAALA